MRFLKIVILSFLLVGCGKHSSQTLTVGTISGPETELVEVAQQVGKERYGLDIKIIEFSDYNLPNAALQDGSLDANVYQHFPYLKASSQANGYQFKIIGKTFVYPAGLYSNHYKSLQALPKSATIGLPNDPSNEARALLLLQKAGLIQFKDDGLANLEDITSNPRQLKFKELDAAQLPRALQDVDAAVINTTFAIPARLNPTKDAIFIEDKHSPYANLIVVRPDSTKMEQLQLLVKALNSPEVKEKAQELFGGGAIPAW